MGKVRLILKISPLLIIPLAVLLILSAEKSPREEIGRARVAISDARAVQANLFSEGLFSEATRKYDYAMKMWSEENSRLIFMRDYTQVRSLAEESFRDALSAKENAIVVSVKVRNALKARINNTKALISNFQEIFTTVPASRSVKEDNSKGLLYFAEAELAYKNGQYSLCDEKLKNCNKYLRESYSGARLMLEEYFSMWPLWSAWVRETIESTRHNGPRAVVVDKYARRCYLYSNGAAIENFRVDLGRNWMGAKKVNGDMATPEGMYLVTETKHGTKTKYYKALLLNYPNTDDKARFNLEKANGFIAKNAEIGNMIEIHGKGGTGTDWTDGCVALTDSDMDLLYPLCKTGTRITIVGSVKPLDEILKQNNR